MQLEGHRVCSESGSEEAASARSGRDKTLNKRTIITLSDSIVCK